MLMDYYPRQFPSSWVDPDPTKIVRLHWRTWVSEGMDFTIGYSTRLISWVKNTIPVTQNNWVGLSIGTLQLSTSWVVTIMCWTKYSICSNISNELCSIYITPYWVSGLSWRVYSNNEARYDEQFDRVVKRKG